ncbi:hypothetical protein [Komarekiella delphini-convector]|nr:hypothetical protein [Komarekiella delphini-convector]
MSILEAGAQASLISGIRQGLTLHLFFMTLLTALRQLSVVNIT